MYRKPFYCVVCKMNRWPGDCGHMQFVAPDPETIEVIRMQDPQSALGEILPDRVPSAGDVYMASCRLVELGSIGSAFKVDEVEVEAKTQDFRVFLSPFDDAPSTPTPHCVPRSVSKETWLKIAAHFRFLPTVRACDVYGCRGNATGLPLYGHEHAHPESPETVPEEDLAAMVKAPSPGSSISDEELLRMVRAGRPTTRSYILGFDTTSIPAGTTATITKRPGVAFRPHHMVIPASLGSDFDVIDIKVRGMSKLVAAAATGVPACAFSETSFGVNLGHLGLVEVDDEISIVVRNTASAPRNFTASLIGHQEPERDPRSGGYLTDEDLAHLARAGVSAAPEEPDDDDKADEADEQKEAEEEDALEGDDDADLEEDDSEDSELEDDDDEEVDKDPDDEKDKEEESKDEEEDEELEAAPEDEIGTGPVCASCPHRLGTHYRTTTKCMACGCDGFVFDGNDVMGSDIDAGHRKAIEARLIAVLPSFIERMAAKPLFASPDPVPSLIAEGMRLQKAARDLGERGAIVRRMPTVKKRFPLPFNEVEIGPWQTATVTVRPQMVCRIRRLVCEQVPGLFVLDIKVGKNSCTLSYADGMPLELFRAFPEDLSKAQIGAIERSGFFENVPQETVQVSMDLTLVVTNKSEVRQKFRAVMLTDAIDF